jgi:uncharacterized caspase-like protein
MGVRIGLAAAVAMIAGALLIFAAREAGAASRVALVIGNGAYQNAPQLSTPPRDAVDVADSLNRLGFTVTRGIDLDGETMRQALDEFGRAAYGAEMAVVFFGGHGLQASGENWLLAVDGSLVAQPGAASGAFALGSVVPRLAQARQLGLVIIDACRVLPTVARTTRSLAASKVVIALTSNTCESATGQNSTYVTALKRHLEQPGLDVIQMLNAVRDDVVAATGRRQTPVVLESLQGSPVFFTPPPDRK